MIPPAAADLIGQVLDGKYRLEAMLGRGGMGAVFRGTQVPIERRVAIKVIHPELAGDPAVARRFAREARGTFRVESEHAIKVLDFAASAAPLPGLLYMVMELLDGRTVAKELDVDGALAPGRALHVARQAALALAAAHRVGIVHRDIKPDNIMLVRHGDDPDFAKVLDFGLAKLIEDAPADAALSAVALTKRGMVFGTPDYMSPEQATGKQLDARSDLYALGATLFEMLTARPPFVGASPMQVLVQHVKVPPPPLADLAPQLAGHAGLAALVARCLAKPPADRPASALDLVAMIDRVAASLPPSSPRPRGAAETVQLPSLGGPAPAGPNEGSHSVWLAQLTADGEPPANPPAPITPAWGMAPTEPAVGGAITGLADRLEAEPGLSRPVRSRWRRPALAGLALAIAAAVVGVWRHGRSPAAAPTAVASAPRDAGRPAAARTDAALAPRAVPVDAAPAPAPDAAIARPTDAEAVAKARAERDRKRREQIAALLAEAEAGYAGKNRLKQMTNADEVLQLDPRHPRANFLFGDALVQARDAANGCRYLERSHTAAARTRMAEVGCK